MIKSIVDIQPGDTIGIPCRGLQIVYSKSRQGSGYWLYTEKGRYLYPGQTELFVFEVKNNAEH